MAFSLNYQALMSKALMSEAPFFRSKAQPSYIEKYDQILSISQYAINQQLQHLYNTPLPTCGLPPPNSGPQPPKEYLISHTLHMSNPKNTMSGKIVGNIACPTISWDHVRATDSRTVKMTLLFLPGSNYRCYSLDGTTDPPVMKEEYIDIEGYKFSFEASLGKKNIQHIQDQLIHPDILQSLKSYVNSENFLVSSLFCLFESAQIASSFEVIDATGKKITDSSSMFGWLMATTHYFTNLSKDDEAKNPFILGYGVTQKLKKHLSSQAEFAPTDYHFSTTGGKIPTLNFLLLNNHREIDIEKDKQAGIFETSFYETIKDNALPPRYDGILAISSKTMTEFLVNDVAPAFWSGAPTQGLGPDAVRITEDTASVLAEGFHKYLSWESTENKWRGTNVNYKDKWNGNSSLDLRIESDLGAHETKEPIARDMKRRLFIFVRGKISMHLVRESTPKGSEIWSEAYIADIFIPYETVLVVTTAADGSWNMERDKERTFFPEVDENNNIVLPKPLSYSEVKDMLVEEVYVPKVVYYVEGKGWFSFLESLGIAQLAGLTSGIGDLVSGFAGINWNDLAKKMASSLQSLSTKIIMPAGDVFMFDGLNTAANYHVYSGVMYGGLTGGGVIHGKEEEKAL